MERVQKKEEQKQVTGQVMSPIQMARVMGNQAVMQMCDDGDTLYIPPWEIGCSSANLRRAMGKTQADGGEAHHIIPCSVVENEALDCLRSQVNINDSWNGILLPGGANGHPLTDTSLDLPFHVKEGANHPDYNRKVLAKAKSCRRPDQIGELAQSILGKIEAMRSGEYIDDIAL